MKKITTFILFNTNKDFLESLQNSEFVNKIFIVNPENPKTSECTECEIINVDEVLSSDALKLYAENLKDEYALILSKETDVKLEIDALEKLINTADSTNAGMLYSDYKIKQNKKEIKHPVIDFQKGSLRDDFNFGAVQLYKSSVFKKAAESLSEDFKFAGLYLLRLKISQLSEIFHIREFLYILTDNKNQLLREKTFDYVNAENRLIQIEMERAVLIHLKDINAYLKPGEYKSIDFSKTDFEYEASVIIPVKNREKTIADAVNSALSQKTRSKFNIIIVDNHSTDRTTEIIKDLAKNDNRIIHLIPDRKDLEIGGCWDIAINNNKCGKFAIQLDSDDLYSNYNTIQKIIAGFYEQKCAMLVGTYQLTDFDLNVKSPGIVDHNEWTDENGRNNILRINGIGAPRAFYTPILRNISIPNISYGENYAVALNISRFYKIGRIYDVLYFYRRWNKNSDADIDTEIRNAYNFYKDKIRTSELTARQSLILNS